MTDRELLEAAAKACGFKPQGMEDGKLYLYGIQDGWNPLEDDGDAFRLAVRLRIDVAFDPSGYAVGAQVSHMRDCTWVERNDGEAATRRAIVRAAASSLATPQNVP